MQDPKSLTEPFRVLVCVRRVPVKYVEVVFVVVMRMEYWLGQNLGYLACASYALVATVPDTVGRILYYGTVYAREALLTETRRLCCWLYLRTLGKANPEKMGFQRIERSRALKS
jgi:hypothetical protein